MTMKYPLTQNWTLSFTHPLTGKRYCIPSTVPGNVEPDLLREGLIREIFPPDNPTAMRDWGGVDDWSYRLEFDSPPLLNGGKTELVF